MDLVLMILNRKLFFLLFIFLSVSFYTYTQSLSGFVYNDADESGIKAASENGIPNIRVYLYNDIGTVGTYDSGTDELLATTTTNELGQYEFFKVDTRIQSSTDDAEESTSSSNSPDTGSSDLEFFNDGGAQLIGLRFSSVQVPPNATVSNGAIIFYADGDQSGSITFSIDAQNAINGATFNSSTDDDIKDRTLTGTPVSWTPSDWSDNTNYPTDDISSLISSVAALGSWAAGNPIVFVISESGGPSANLRRAETFDGGGAGGDNWITQLTFDYTTYPTIANYIVRVETSDLDSYFAVTEPTDSYSAFTVASSSDSFTENFGYKSQKVFGYVYIDEDEDGIFNSAEDGISGVTINFYEDVATVGTLDGSDVLLLSETTNSSGRYEFSTLIEVSVSQSSDDAEELSGSVDLTSTDLELVDDGGVQTVGIRFNNINIPQGATIDEAYIDFYTDEVTINSSSTLTIRGVDVDNSVTFDTDANDISSKTTTTASASWTPSAWLEINELHTTSDLQTIVQEIVNRGSWAANNSMSFIITGTGTHTADSYDGNSSQAPKLRIKYSFTGTVPDDYALEVITSGVPSPYTISTPASGEIFINLASNTESEIYQNFGFTAQKIRGFVYLDADADGTLDASEGGLAGVRVHLYEDLDASSTVTAGDQLIETVLTDYIGKYIFEDFYNKMVSRISDSDDDAEEDVSDGSVGLTSTDLEMIDENGGDGEQLVGLRFLDIRIANGATINSAYIDFTADEAQSIDTDLTIHGQSSATPATFTTTTNDISSTGTRPRTTASVNWDNIATWAVGDNNSNTTTPNLSSIVGEITSLGGWASGNNMVFIISDNSNTSSHRTADSYDGDATTAARLTIDFTHSTTRNYVIAVETADLAPGYSFTNPVSGVRSLSVSDGSTNNLREDFGYDGQSIICFIVPEAQDRLEMVNRFTGTNSVIGTLGTTNTDVEAITIDYVNNVLYGMDADQLGTIDLNSGEFTAVGSTVGSGDGASGTIAFTDVDALAYEVANDRIFAVQAGTSRLLFAIDPNTGKLIPDIYGSGIDYIQVTDTSGNSNPLSELSDLTFDPNNELLYGINLNGTTRSSLIQINKSNGNAGYVKDNIQDGGINVTDLESIAYTTYTSDTIYATSGSGATFYSIDVTGAVSTAAVATEVTTGSNALTGTDYESCDCFFTSVPELEKIINEPLPIELISFIGIIKEEIVILSWVTASELNTNEFEVQKSSDGLNFKTFASVKAAGKSNASKNYNYTDQNPLKQGKSYYRLKIIDKDNSFDFSDVIEVVNNKFDDILDFNIYPNPVKGEIHIKFQNITNKPVNISVLNANGSTIVSRNFDQFNLNEMKMDFSKFPKGIYFIRLNFGNGHVIKKVLHE